MEKHCGDKAGEFGDKVIDLSDSLSESLGYSIFGLNASTYLQAAGESFDEYRRLREEGYSQEDAFGMASEKAMFAILSEKVDDYIGKNNPIGDVLYEKDGIIRKVDTPNIRRYNGEKLGEQEYARLVSAIGTYKPNAKGYVSQILDNENGDPAIIYDVFIKDDGSIMVFGKHGVKNIHEKEEYYNAYRK